VAECTLPSGFFHQLPSSHRDVRQLAICDNILLLFSKPELACHFVTFDVVLMSQAWLKDDQLVSRLFFSNYDMKLFWVFYCAQ
jgi:hypothetical protein